MREQLRDRLIEYMESLRTIDCHSHTALSSQYYAQKHDLFNLMAYFARDIAGVNEQYGWPQIESLPDDAAKWAALKKVLDRARNVSYWRHNIIMYQKLFDLADDELSDSNWAELNERIKEKTADRGWYRHVTVDVCRLLTQVRNVP